MQFVWDFGRVLNGVKDGLDLVVGVHLPDSPLAGQPVGALEEQDGRRHAGRLPPPPLLAHGFSDDGAPFKGLRTQASTNLGRTSYPSAGLGLVCAGGVRLAELDAAPLLVLVVQAYRQAVDMELKPGQSSFFASATVSLIEELGDLWPDDAELSGDLDPCLFVPRHPKSPRSMPIREHITSILAGLTTSRV